MLISRCKRELEETRKRLEAAAAGGLEAAATGGQAAEDMENLKQELNILKVC